MDLAKIPAINEIEDIAEKRVFMRLDLNAPIADGQVADDTRLEAVLPLINYALARSCRVILASHLGRPKGEVKKEYSLEPVAKRLAELLNHEILLSDYPVGDSSRNLTRQMRTNDIVMLENLRFDPGETKNNPTFAKELASYADIYINDAFGTSHRAHASTAGIVEHMEGTCGIGFLIKHELDALGRLLDDPARPFVGILGGAKVSDKIQLIKQMFKKCQVILIGGAMAYTFLLAQGKEVGESRVEKNQVKLAKELLTLAEANQVEFLLPTDHVIGSDPDTQESSIVEGNIPEGMCGFDIGPQTIETYTKKIENAGKVFWNGPMGFFERPLFAEGTEKVAKALAKTDAYTVIGGGDSAAAIRKFDLHTEVSHVSTGGGASLTFLRGEELPALVAVAKAQTK